MEVSDSKGGGHVTSYRRAALSLFIVIVCHGTAAAQFGGTLTGVGPINRSMGGASTAAPLDTLGAFMWNPATITALPNATDFGVELMLPHARLSSTVNQGALAPGFPPVTLSGSDKSNSGTFPLPEFGFVFRPEESPWSFGVGLLTVAGFSANYPGDLNNPILSPPPGPFLPPPFRLGVGPIYTQYMVMQLLPTVAREQPDVVVA